MAFSPGSQPDSEAGLFRNRSGELRRPVRNLVAAVADNVAARRSARFGAGCGGQSASTTLVSCDPASGVCSVATVYHAPDAGNSDADAAAAQAFVDAVGTRPPVEDVPQPQSQLPDARLGSSAPSSRVIPLPDANLAARERRLGVRERIAFEILKRRPDLRVAVAAYAKSKGLGAIDPNNLSAILDVLLAFFEKLLPLILQLVQVPASGAAGPPLVLIG